MVTAINGLNSASAAYGAAVQQPLSPQTKAQLQTLGVNTNQITTEAQGQTALQSAQQSQAASGTQQTQGSQQSSGDHSEFKALKEEAAALAAKVGASVASNAKLSDIMTAIGQALSTMQAQAANDPQKAAQIASIQTQYQSICQQLSSMQSSMETSKAQAAQTENSQIQASMNGLAIYNIASINMNTIATQKQ